MALNYSTVCLGQFRRSAGKGNSLSDGRTESALHCDYFITPTARSDYQRQFVIKLLRVHNLFLELQQCVQRSVTEICKSAHAFNHPVLT